LTKKNNYLNKVLPVRLVIPTAGGIFPGLIDPVDVDDD
jgi:hypothetical protein